VRVEAAVKKFLTIAFVALLSTATSALLIFRSLEARIAQSFKVPQIDQTPELRNNPHASYDFSFASLNGQSHRLSDLRGKVVFVNFWGTWCIRCVAEMPTIQKLYETLKDDPSVAFVIASRLDTPERVRAYAKYGRYDLPFYMVNDSDIPQALQFNQYPTTFIFRKDGSLAETQIGGADWDDPSVVQSIRRLEIR
jgi:thiol-disulfide isomerase/thioredoxin